MMKLMQGLVACLATIFLAVPAFAGAIGGVVVGVSDGDTITVLDAGKQQYKIRLSGIDAPEKSQPYGESSKESLSEMVFGKTVSITWDKQDRYGRTVGKINLGGQDINLEQVRRGMAWHYKAYIHEQPFEDQKNYGEAETAARVSRRGLWRDSTPTAPWDYRRKGR